MSTQREQQRPCVHTARREQSRRLLVKVCGLRDGENIRQIAQLGVDWIGMIFWAKSPRNVTTVPTQAGISPGSGIPSPRRVGVFVDEMAQNIITRVVNFRLDLIQLHGHESPTLIRNLRSTLDPAIRPGIKIIKAISVSSRDDIAAYRQYEDCVDYFLFDTKCQTVGGSGQHFDWAVLADYDGVRPFLISGGIGPGDAPRLRHALATDGFPVERCVGIDLNSRFETEPGIKDINKLKQFLEQL